MLGEPIAGVGYLLRGLSLVNQPGLRRFVAIPLLINFLVFGVLIFVAVGQFGLLVESVVPTLPDWLAWLEYLLWVVFGLAAAVFIFFTFSLVANLIGAPFNGLLAEAVERHLTGQPLPGGDSVMTAIKKTPQILWDEIGKLAYFVLWAIPFLILFVIPVVNLAAPFIWFLFTAWMLAIEYMDYPMGNHEIRPMQQRQRLQRRRLLSLGFGGVTLGATLIPLVNLFVMPVAVAGATAMWVERFKDDASA